VNNKYDCLKLHHVGCLIKQIDDAQNHKYQIYGIISRTLKRRGGERGGRNKFKILQETANSNRLFKIPT